MKIRNYITLLFAVVSIFLLLALAGYLTFENVDDANPVKQSIANLIPGLSISTEKQTDSVTDQPSHYESLLNSGLSLRILKLFWIQPVHRSPDRF